MRVHGTHGSLFGCLFQAHESLEEAKSMFEEINNELHRELPRFYDYRVEFVANNLIKLFTAEGTLHNNTGKVWGCQNSPRIQSCVPIVSNYKYVSRCMNLLYIAFVSTYHHQ